MAGATAGILFAIAIASGSLRSWAPAAEAQNARNPVDETLMVSRGRYLAIIGVCSACHTAPNVPDTPPTDPAQLSQERVFRTEPDWFKYIDPDGRNYFAGGVPFVLRLGQGLSGIVYTTNITPDPVDGIGTWTVDEIADTIRTGKRPARATGKPAYLYLFPPHTFYHNLSSQDALALAYYLKSVPPKKNQVPLPARQLPAGFEPNADSNPIGPVSPLKEAPQGRSIERALYLTHSLVGCRECHSHHSNDPALVAFVPDHQAHMDMFQRSQTDPSVLREYKKNNEWDAAEPFLGPLIPFAGGGSGDPFQGVFRLGPDLPLRATDKGVSLFPYPGYAVLYGPNLTRFGHNGPRSTVSTNDIVRALRHGIATDPDEYGRPDPLLQVMMWPFYASMSDNDAYSIAEYIKSLTYIPNLVSDRTLYGEDWEGMFTKVFGQPPDDHDREIFGKKKPD